MTQILRRRTPPAPGRCAIMAATLVAASHFAYPAWAEPTGQHAAADCTSDTERPAIACLEREVQEHVSEAWQAPVKDPGGSNLEQILDNEENPIESPSPFLVVPKDGKATVEMSLNQWQSYQKALEQQKINDLKRAAPDGLTIPKSPATTAPAVDLWSKTDFKDAAVQSDEHGFSSKLGAAMRINENVRLGASADLLEERPGEAGTDGARQAGYLAGPNIGVTLAPGLSLEAYTAWGEEHTSNTSTSTIDSEQIVRRTGVNAQIEVGRVKLMPRAAYVHEETTTTSAPDSDLQSETEGVVSSRLEINPEIRRPFELEDGKVIEPFINFRSSLGLEGAHTPDTSATAPVDKVGIGLSLSSPDNYKVEATTDVEKLGDKDTPGIDSRLKLTVPLD